MSKNRLAFFGWSKYGQKIYLYDGLDHDIKFVYEKVKGGMSSPVNGDDVAISIYYDMSDAYQEIAKTYLGRKGYDYDTEADDWRWMPVRMATTAIPEAKLPQPDEGESTFDMLKRWMNGKMTEYEEIELINNLTDQQVVKEE